ncbi:MAG: GNAT family N-acetyltransferase [Anaerorhabdus sp.]
MDVQKTKREDVKALMNIINQAKDYLKRMGIDQWQNGYPNEETISSDIEQGVSYVVQENDIIVGAMALIFQDEKTYRSIDGKWLSDGDYGVVHRLVIKEQLKGKGIADKLLDEAVTQARNQGIEFLRIDTHRDNLSMQRWINKNNFVFCGIIQLEDGALRNAYEKKVSEGNEV